METESNLLDGSPVEILGKLFAEADGDAYVINPSEEMISTVVTAATETDAPPRLLMIAEGKRLRNVMDDFIVASNAADLVEADKLEMRTAEDWDANSVVVTEAAVAALVNAGPRVGGLVTHDGEFVETARSAFGAKWERAEPYTLRTPAISRVRDSLTTEMGPDTEAAFSEVLGSLETARGNGDGLDEVTISLLVAAKNEELFYDISRWGEDVGVASKATFSRVKNQLEEVGLIGTEKVPVDVGRPRQRLTLKDERLKTADTSQLASVAQSLLN
jgi:hypothetical protein